MQVWAYLDHGSLFIALSPEMVPQGVEAIEFTVESPDDIIYDGTVIRLKTPEEKLQERESRTPPSGSSGGSSVGYGRVDLTNATSDYDLQVGEEAYISFSNVASAL